MNESRAIATLPEETDVVIVGAGPTGLSLACGLAARGLDFVILDRAAEGENTSRAAVVHARTLEVLGEIGATEELLRRGVGVPHFTIRDRDRTLLNLTFDRLPTPYPYTLMVPQDVTERVLHERLIALGGSVYREHAVTAVESNEREVTVAVRGPGGCATKVRARYAVGCDGMHSVVRQQADIGFAGASYAQSFVLADVHMEWPLPRDQVELFFSPDGLLVVAPLPEDRFRVVATLDQAPDHPDLDAVQALLDARGPVEPAKIRDLVWSSRFSVHHRLADGYRRGRVFLAGDAAHVHSPAGGQGMNLGIQDAVTLAGILADVLAGHADESHLNSYGAIRRPVAAEVVKMTDRITRAATARHPVTRAARNTALGLIGRLQPVRHQLAMNLSGLAADLATGPASWTRATLVEPSTAGFVHVGASSGSWRVPLALPRARRRTILALMNAAAHTLRRDPRVVRADVFEAVLRPPGRDTQRSGRAVPDADFDAVLLVETGTVADAADVAADRVLAGHLKELRRAANRSLVFAGSNARRIATVDHERQGVFLFNYFSAPTVEANLFAWQYTAGWFQDQTGLTNSTVLQPFDADPVPYTLVNHCRWDRLRDVVPSLLFKRSFRGFVLRVFDDNGVTPRPILYKLHRPS